MRSMHRITNVTNLDPEWIALPPLPHQRQQAGLPKS